MHVRPEKTDITWHGTHSPHEDLTRNACERTWTDANGQRILLFWSYRLHKLDLPRVLRTDGWTLDLRSTRRRRYNVKTGNTLVILMKYDIYDTMAAVIVAAATNLPDYFQHVKVQCEAIRINKIHCYQWIIRRLWTSQVQMSRDMRFPTIWQSPFKLRNSKWCAFSSLTVIQYSSD